MPLLYDHPLMKTLGAHAADIIRDVFPDGHSLEPSRPLTSSERYSQRCLNGAGEVMFACDQLEFALAYLSGYRTRRTASGGLISRTDYISYQLENLYLRMTMVVDRALKLANDVFRLGVPPRECRFRAIADNDHVRATPVRLRLRALDKVVDPYRPTRNVIAHHERYSDEDLHEIEGFFILEKAGDSENDDLLKRFAPHFKLEADRYIRRQREELAPIVDALTARAGDVFSALLPVFERQHSGLR